MILDSFKLDNKVALVTGAGRGLGASLAIGLAEAGADLVLAGRQPIVETANKIRALGRRVATFEVDLEQGSEVSDKLISDTIDAMGKVDILVNNAGIIRRAPITEHTAQDWQAVLNVNLSSPFYLAQAVARHLIARKSVGKIINIASMLSYQGGIMVPGYTASKGGIRTLTMLLANELAQHGICVNAIAPGYFSTDNTAPLQADPTRNAAIVARIPAGRWGNPDELKGAVVFLASAASDYMHGFTLAIDGGWLAR